MAAITLTPQDGGASVVVNTNIIYRVFSYNGGSRVMYGKGGANPYIMDVTALPSAIVNSSYALVQVDTLVNGVTVTEYLYAGNSANGDGKGIMMVNTNGTGSVIFFKYTEEAAPIYIYSTDSPSVIAGRMNALTTVPATFPYSVQAITASGATAVSTTAELTTLDSTLGAQTLSLANSATAGFAKIITMTVFGTGNNAVLTPATPSGFATITFNSANDTVTLVWTGSAWVIAGYSGVVIA